MPGQSPNGPRLLVPSIVMLGVLACGGEGGPAGGEGVEGFILPSAEGVALEPQAVSFFGEPLFAAEDTAGVIARADSAFLESPENVDLLIATGRVRRNFFQYRQAIQIYTRAIEMAPDDWRPYRYRGHRHISVREFDKAVNDLEKAKDLAPLNWDVSYHLGLAYFLEGRHSDAAEEYLRCLGLSEDPDAISAQSEDFRSCSQNAQDPGSRVAMTEWAVRAAARSGRDARVAELLESIPADLEIGENLPYYHDLLFYKGLKTADELLGPGPDAPYRKETVGFGVANWLIVQGDTVGAVGLLEELVQDTHWPGFGRIAAEAELYRLSGE
ncbi:MAG: tetratricopeptide repeat protein [Gemmatimonadetes bacterium]|nr:tetratricopeptide repeat protein [Gemmatimonadota bacterium]NNM04744.1 tetratricopeptide repeat protein [Gemmatimonadota bacterium]